MSYTNQVSNKNKTGPFTKTEQANRIRKMDEPVRNPIGPGYVKQFYDANYVKQFCEFCKLELSQWYLIPSKVNFPQYVTWAQTIVEIDSVMNNVSKNQPISQDFLETRYPKLHTQFGSGFLESLQNVKEHRQPCSNNSNYLGFANNIVQSQNNDDDLHAPQESEIQTVVVVDNRTITIFKNGDVFIKDKQQETEFISVKMCREIAIGKFEYDEKSSMEVKIFNGIQIHTNKTIFQGRFLNCHLITGSKWNSGTYSSGDFTYPSEHQCHHVNCCSCDSAILVQGVSVDIQGNVIFKYPFPPTSQFPGLGPLESHLDPNKKWMFSTKLSNFGRLKFQHGYFEEDSSIIRCGINMEANGEFHRGIFDHEGNLVYGCSLDWDRFCSGRFYPTIKDKLKFTGSLITFAAEDSFEFGDFVVVDNFTKIRTGLHVLRKRTSDGTFNFTVTKGQFDYASESINGYNIDEFGNYLLGRNLPFGNGKNRQHFGGHKMDVYGSYFCGNHIPLRDTSFVGFVGDVLLSDGRFRRYVQWTDPKRKGLPCYKGISVTSEGEVFVGVMEENQQQTLIQTEDTNLGSVAETVVKTPQIITKLADGVTVNPDLRIVKQFSKAFNETQNKITQVEHRIIIEPDCETTFVSFAFPDYIRVDPQKHYVFKGSRSHPDFHENQFVPKQTAEYDSSLQSLLQSGMIDFCIKDDQTIVVSNKDKYNIELLTNPWQHNENNDSKSNDTVSPRNECPMNNNNSQTSEIAMVTNQTVIDGLNQLNKRKSAIVPANEVIRKEKRIRNDRAELELKLLDLFAQKDFISFKELQDATNEPKASLQEALGDIAIRHTTGEFINQYQLREKYRIQK